jgi:hypothetical protein
MDTFTIFEVCVITVWVALGIKLMHDQIALLKKYRKVINPPFPLLPNEEELPYPSLAYPFTHSLRLFLIPFEKFKNAQLSRLARKVRFDLGLLVLTMITSGIAFWNLEL